MNKPIVRLGLTLDGVMQDPARPDEDMRGGFRQSGWAAQYVDGVSMAVAAEGMSKKGDALPPSRKNYMHFYDARTRRNDGNPFTDRLKHNNKFVASTTLKEPFPRVNSSFVRRIR